MPQQLVDGFASSGGGGIDLTGTGDLGSRILASAAAGHPAAVAPLIPNIVNGIHEAFSIAIASTFWIGIVGATVAALLVLLLKEETMRTTFDFAPEATAPEAPAPAEV